MRTVIRIGDAVLILIVGVAMGIVLGQKNQSTIDGGKITSVQVVQCAKGDRK